MTIIHLPSLVLQRTFFDLFIQPSVYFQIMKVLLLAQSSFDSVPHGPSEIPKGGRWIER
jgi:hypothetical protein